MGREIRRVPVDWEHPVNEKGCYIPLFGEKYSVELFNWKEGKKQWDNGFKTDFNGGYEPKNIEQEGMTYMQWNGIIPKIEDYMPEWHENQLTHIQLYENTTEGTPKSPIFHHSKIYELAEYASINCTSFADFKQSKTWWIELLTSQYNKLMKSDKETLLQKINEVSEPALDWLEEAKQRIQERRNAGLYSTAEIKTLIQLYQTTYIDGDIDVWLKNNLPK